MSAHEDFCGCGEYSCGQCFDGDKTETGNAWLDQVTVEVIPDTPFARAALRRLKQHGVTPDDSQSR